MLIMFTIPVTTDMGRIDGTNVLTNAMIQNIYIATRSLTTPLYK